MASVDVVVPCYKYARYLRACDRKQPDVMRDCFIEKGAVIEAEGFPYAGSYTGPEAIVQGVFHRLATEWTGYRAEAKTYVTEGDQVVAFGTYHGTYKATGKSMQADFAHHYHLNNGKIIRMKQYVDSHKVQQALVLL